MDMVRLIKTLGYLIGSCSDHPVSYQQRLWAQHNIRVDFTVLKHRLDDVKAQFQTEAYYHIGDTDMDHFYAARAGFRFVKANVTTLRCGKVDIESLECLKPTRPCPMLSSSIKEVGDGEHQVVGTSW
jgi:hypothetical protein